MKDWSKETTMAIHKTDQRRQEIKGTLDCAHENGVMYLQAKGNCDSEKITEGSYLWNIIIAILSKEHDALVDLIKLEALENEQVEPNE